MDLVFQHVHIDLMSLPSDELKSQGSTYEASLIKAFREEMFVTEGVVLATQPQQGHRYKVVIGFEIVRACKKAMIERVPCLVSDSFTHEFIDLFKAGSGTEEGRGVISDKPENVVQNAIKLFNQLNSLNLSYRKASKLAKIGKKSTIYDSVRLAKKLHPKVKGLLEDGKLKKSAARSISYVAMDQQLELATKAIKNRWTVKQIELERSSNNDKPMTLDQMPDVHSTTSRLEDSLGCPVKIIVKTAQTGQLKLTFGMMDELYSLLHKIGELPEKYRFTVKGSTAMAGQGKGYIQVEYKNLDLFDQLLRK